MSSWNVRAYRPGEKVRINDWGYTADDLLPARAVS